MSHIRAVLVTWQDAERVLERLPPNSREAAEVQLAAVRLKAAYETLTAKQPPSRASLADTKRALEEAASVLGRVAPRGSL